MSYNPQMYMPQPFAANMYYQQVNQFNNVVPVKGIQGANAFPMGPNSKGVFIDTENDWMFFRETDAGGYGMAQWFDFYPHVEKPEGKEDDVPAESVRYVSQDDFDRLVAKVDEMRARLKTTRKEDDGE